MDNWKTAAIFVLTLAAVSISCFVLYPFLPAITGAMLLTVLTRKAYTWWHGKIRNSTVAATSAVFLVALCIIGPLLFMGQYVVRQAITGFQMLQDGRGQSSLDEVLDRFPRVASAIEASSEFLSLGEALQKLAGYFASRLVDVLSDSFTAIGQIVVMLFLLFFLYRDEKAMLQFFSQLSPLKSSETRFLTNRLGDTIRATVLGRLVVAISQGAVATTVFAVLGVHAAVILGLLTAVLGLIPPFGPYLVWLPLAIWFGITGHWVKMAVLLAAGSLIISTLDNFLYPILVGAHLRQHTAVVFLSILGGIWAFGIAGVILGPFIFSATEALFSIWQSRLGREPAPD